MPVGSQGVTAWRVTGHQGWELGWSSLGATFFERCCPGQSRTGSRSEAARQLQKGAQRKSCCPNVPQRQGAFWSTKHTHRLLMNWLLIARGVTRCSVTGFSISGSLRPSVLVKVQREDLKAPRKKINSIDDQDTDPAGLRAVPKRDRHRLWTWCQWAALFHAFWCGHLCVSVPWGMVNDASSRCQQ